MKNGKRLASWVLILMLLVSVLGSNAYGSTFPTLKDDGIDGSNMKPEASQCTDTFLQTRKYCHRDGVADRITMIFTKNPITITGGVEYFTDEK